MLDQTGLPGKRPAMSNVQIADLAGGAHNVQARAYDDADVATDAVGITVTGDGGGGGLTRISHTRHGLRRVQAAAPPGAGQKA